MRKVDLESAIGPNGTAAPKKRNPLEDLKREIMIMKKMKHPNIVTLSEVCVQGKAYVSPCVSVLGLHPLVRSSQEFM